MRKRLSWLLILPSLVVPFLLSCSSSNSPFTASNAKISVVVENSNHQRSTSTVSDSVGKLMRVGVSAYLGQYIKSVTVLIGRSVADTDTALTFGSSTVWSDTQWMEIVFRSPGARTVAAVATIQGAPQCSATASIIIASPPTPTYTLTYSGNGNTGGAAPSDTNAYAQGAGVTIKANTGSLTRTGYTFAGWNTAADGSGASYAGGEMFLMTSGNVTLYAKWTQNPTYTVIYSGNNNTGGTVPTDANAYEQGASVTVKANAGNLVRSGYTFTGWNTAADASGTSYAGGAAFNIGAANVILYAVWTQNSTYTVAYNGNGNTGGTAPTDANEYEQGASVIVKANSGNLVRTGYTFAGWNTAADGSGTSYAGAATFAMGSANVTLYAKWTQNPTYTVTYNGNGSTSGSAPTDVNAYLQGATVTVAANTGNLAKTSYTFAGWNTANDGIGTSYAGGETFNIGAANVTLFAKWTQNPTYTVTYSGNGNSSGSAPIDANAYEQGATVTVKGNTGNLLRTGYNFTGWNTAADGSGTLYIAGATFTMGNAAVTLYAMWAAIQTYTVTYNANGSTGGTVPTDATAYQQGASVTVKTNSGSLVHSGYTFAGWNTAADGSGTSYAAGATLTMETANITLYARWTQNPTYTVTYNSNANTTGTVPTDANAYLQGATVTVSGNTGNLAKTGFTFAGWNTAADGSGTSYAAGATFAMGTANVTLYAKWTVAVLTVKFNSNGGSAVDSQNVAYNTTAVSPAAPTQNGFIFAGWFSDQALTIQFNFTTAITSATTLYAKWTPVYTVTYDGNSNTGGTVPVDVNKYANGIVVTVLNNTGLLAKTGYTFAGWNTSADGTGTDRSQGSTFLMGSSNVILYAKWMPNTYVVTFDGQGATVAANPATINVTSPVTTVASLPAPPAKTSYIFAGWYTAVNGGGTQFTESTVVNANITVYAKWEIRDSDGNVYTETTINGKVWMVQNLKTTRYNDGTMIPQVTDSGLWVGYNYPAFCWYKNDSTTYKNAYGALYNWYAASSGKLAPIGWHVPTDPEWMALFNYYGGQVQATSDALREQGTAHWPAPNTGATNSSGFTAIPTGTRSYNGGFYSDTTTMGVWWTSSQNLSGINEGLFYDVAETWCEEFYSPMGEGISIRCVRDY